MHARAPRSGARQRPALSVAPAPQSPSTLVAALVAAIDEGGVVTLLLGRQRVRARLDGSVDAVVITGALARGERVIAQEEDGEWLVLGALRSKASVGVDPVDDCVIQAKRLRVEAADEVRFVTGGASLVLRAAGHVETIARHITSRAAGVHKIVGRMLHLN